MFFRCERISGENSSANETESTSDRTTERSIPSKSVMGESPRTEGRADYSRSMWSMYPRTDCFECNP